MAIDINTETLLTATEASKRLPNRPHFKTIKRWWSEGCCGVKLESTVIGVRRFTSVEALERFHQARNRASNPELAQRSTPTQRQRKVNKLNRELAAEGL